MISVVMLTKNSMATIKAALDAIVDFDEIIIIDTGSTDQTLEIAKQYKNVKIYREHFNGFGPLRNLGSNFAKNEWILALDSDEIITRDLKDEILSIKLDAQSIYGFHFHNFYNEKQIKSCGWHPETHIRLYNKSTTGFSTSFVHEKLEEQDHQICYFKNPIKHFPYRNIDDFLKKMGKYSTLFALQNKNKKKSSLLKAILHGFFAFFKSYIIKRGFLAGKEGFIISSYNANTAFYKYLKLMEINFKE